MTDPEKTERLKLLNASGFAFQLAIEAAVCAQPGQPRWRIVAREHPWKTTSADGYIDLVLSDGQTYLVVECKRTTDATWLFLMYDDKQLSRSHARIRWTNTVPHHQPLAGWGDIQVYPSSPETDFCVVRGQGEGHSPLLERLASSVTESAEGLTAHLLELTERTATTRIVIPVIVTNATLVLGSFKPGNVDLATGKIDAATFTTVQHVRFRKSLAGASHPEEFEPEELRDLSASSERTIFIINSEYFTAWLNDFQLNMSSAPWSSARARAGGE